MKKFIVLGLIGLLIMVFSAAAYAQDKLEFRASGAFEAVSFLYRNISSGAGPWATGGTTGIPDGMITTRWGGGGSNVPAGGPGQGFRPRDPFTNNLDSGAWNRTNSYMEYRGNLKFDAIMGKSLSGTVMFEMDSSRWGEGAGDRGAAGFWTADRAAVEIKSLYLDFGIPYIGIPVPMTVRVGIQPLGVRPHIFMISDGAGVTGGIKIDPVMIGLMWAKPVEGRDATADDANVYGLNVNAKLGTLTPGFFVNYWNMNSYPFNLATVDAEWKGKYGFTPPYSADFWWLGAYLDGKLGPVDINFDFVYDRGTIIVRDNAKATAKKVTGFNWDPAMNNKVKYRGFATQLKINFPWEKFNFGTTGMYTSGADQRKTGRLGVPGEEVADNVAGYSKKVGSYVVPPGSENFAAWGESLFLGSNYITGTAYPLGMFPSLGAYPLGVNRGAIGGTWVAKLYASMNATPWYKVTLQGLYIGDTTKHGNTLGDAWKGTNWANARLRDDKDIGFELDLMQDIQIYKNLKWSIGAGILFAGDALDQAVDAAKEPRNKSPKDPWILATKLRYDF